MKTREELEEQFEEIIMKEHGFLALDRLRTSGEFDRIVDEAFESQPTKSDIARFAAYGLLYFTIRVFTFQLAWVWFFVPLGLPTIGFVHAVAIMACLTMFITHPIVLDVNYRSFEERVAKGRIKEFIKEQRSNVWKSAFALGFFYVLSWLMLL